MDINAIITMVTDFFSSIPWENVIQSFVGSIQGINWDSLASLFDWFDFTDGPLQAAIDAIAALFANLQ